MAGRTSDKDISTLKQNQPKDRKHLPGSRSHTAGGSPKQHTGMVGEI